MPLSSFKIPFEKGVIRCTHCLRPCCMLNAALLGGAEARNALQSAMFDDDLPQVDTNWCVGGCKSWNETEEGKSRMELLRKLMLQWAEDNPLEYQELRRRL